MIRPRLDESVSAALSFAIFLGACGVRMPRGDVPLDSIDVNNIRNWIIENALNN